MRDSASPLDLETNRDDTLGNWVRTESNVDTISVPLDFRTVGRAT